MLPIRVVRTYYHDDEMHWTLKM